MSDDDVILGRLTPTQKAVCRKLSREDGPIAIYARMVLALNAGAGIRLTSHEIAIVIFTDDAVSRVIRNAIDPNCE